MGKAVYEIDGVDFSTLEEFYDAISRTLIVPSNYYWGRNLNAFNDILRGGFGTPEGGFVLRWKNSSLSQSRLGYPETLRQLRHRATDSELADAAAGRGPTVFDWLVEIILRHGPGGTEAEDGVELLLE
jgi:RNAse (barnase) inhibitor barstar